MNCGGSEIEGMGPSNKFSEDSCFEGGDVIETGDPIASTGNYTSLYQSARYGTFSYKIDRIAAGQYFVDLHFAEIVNTYGPKGLRTFDIFVQEEKVTYVLIKLHIVSPFTILSVLFCLIGNLMFSQGIIVQLLKSLMRHSFGNFATFSSLQIVAGLDIYKIVGANRALQIVDIRASVVQNEALVINFRGLTGTPIICGIAIRKASPLPRKCCVLMGIILFFFYYHCKNVSIEYVPCNTTKI
jgi:kinesin family member C2/C3